MHYHPFRNCPWTNVLANDLKDEERSSVQNKNTPPGSFMLLEEPKLNLEVTSEINGFVASISDNI